MKDVLLLVAGWILGLVSVPISEWVTRRREKKELVSGITTELADLKDRAVAFAYYVWVKHCAATRERREWVVNELSGSHDPACCRIVENTRRLLTGSDEEMAAVDRAMAKEHSGVQLRKLDLPFIESQVQRLAWLDRRIRTGILKIRAHIRMFNECAVEAHEYLVMTFDSSITGENRDRVVLNMRLAERLAADRARIIVEELDALGNIR